MAAPTAVQRRAFAKSGVAMPDGSYYIRPNVPEDLGNAIQAVGRASGTGGTSDEEQRNAVRRHIIKRAAALNRSKEIPNTWNPDGTLKHDDFSVEDFLEHFGRKGMKWGVRHSKAELEGKASEHEKIAAAHAAAADNAAKEAADVARNGVNSAAFKRVYGEKAAQQGEWAFYGQNGQTRAQALQQTHNNLRLIHNQYASSANRHSAKAVKLREKAAEATHSAVDIDEDFIEHFGRKGMKWGEHVFGRTDSAGRNKAAAKAASDSHASPDAKAASDLQARAHASGTKNLNNKELQDLVTRMNLEQQYSRLSTGDVKNGKNFVQKYNAHGQTGVTAFKTTREIVKILGPLIVAGAAAAAASKAGSHSGPVRMPQLAIGS